MGPTPATISNVQAIGELLYSRYLYVFEAAGLVLLVAMIGAIVLTHRTRRDERAQNASRQIARRPEDAIRNVNQPVGVGVEL
jgi:NADH-quinone oxidoreductase subunit J